MKWTKKGHEFDAIGNLLAGKNNLYIYGAGRNGKDLHRMVRGVQRWLQWNVTFVDNDPAKQKAGYCGERVISHDELLQCDREKSFIVICTPDRASIMLAEQLAEEDFVFMKDVFTYWYMVNKYLSVHLIYQHNLVYFSSINIIPSTVCNLNCDGCLNFNPYITKHTIRDIGDIKQDVEVFFAAVDLIDRFQISGGEPFLYPDLEKLVEYIGSNYLQRMTRFEIVTNGTVVPGDALCEVIKRHHVHVYLDDYREAIPGINEKYAKIIDVLREHHIEYYENRVETWFDLAPHCTNNAARSDREMQVYFDLCGCPYSTLENKAISACNYARYADKAGLCREGEKERFDLTIVNAHNRKDLVEFRLRCNERGYLNFCRTCAGYHYINKNYIKAARQIPKTTPQNCDTQK